MHENGSTSSEPRTETRTEPRTEPRTDPRTGLRADCGRCFGLCCVARPFARSADFAIDKGAGEPCPNLRSDSRCGIHDRLRDTGFTGCTVYDCFGAGQQVSQVIFGGVDWRSGTQERARSMFDVFPVVRHLHELLRYLGEALTLPAARPVHDDIRRLISTTERLTRQSPEELAALDVGPHRQEAGELLLRASEFVRAGVGGARKKDRRGADLMGARLRGADLRGVSLRGVNLDGVDLSGAVMPDGTTHP